MTTGLCEPEKEFIMAMDSMGLRDLFPLLTLLDALVGNKTSLQSAQVPEASENEP